MNTKSQMAVDLFNSGFNCSQSVLAVFCEQYGMEREQALKVACGLGGGMRSGEVCGAVSGAIIVIGLKYGQFLAEDAESKKICYEKTTEFISQFRTRYQSIICRDLLGCDISTEEGMELARQKELFKTTCIQMIQNSVSLLEELEY